MISSGNWRVLGLSLLILVLYVEAKPDFDEKEFRQKIEMFDQGLPPLGGWKGDLSDVQYILCDTCKAMVSEVLRYSIKQRKKMKGKKFSEYSVQEQFIGLCDAKAKVGKWIPHYDIDESLAQVDQDETSPAKLSLKRHKKAGKCKAKCKTIEMACGKIKDEIFSDFMETIFLRQDELGDAGVKNTMTEKFCYEQTSELKGSCANEYPFLDVNKRVLFNEEFQAKTQNDKFIDQLNQQLKNLNFKNDL